MESKRIFITGATSGIGRAAAIALQEFGHQVFAVGRRAEKLETLPTGIVTQTCDVLDVASIKLAVDRAISKMGGIDVCIPNAGLGCFDPLDQGKLEEWHQMVDVNFKGVLSTLHACLPHLVEARGHVINIGSVAARNVFPNSGVYCATKHAILALSESLRIEFKHVLAVTTINPGAVDTPFIQQTSNAELRDSYAPEFAKGMEAETVAEAILHAIQGRSSAIYSEITLRPSLK
ncbi:MAG: SDR family oxidoreductase [Flavobacteriales bacterium]